MRLLPAISAVLRLSRIHLLCQCHPTDLLQRWVEVKNWMLKWVSVYSLRRNGCGHWPQSDETQAFSTTACVTATAVCTLYNPPMCWKAIFLVFQVTRCKKSRLFASVTRTFHFRGPCFSTFIYRTKTWLWMWIMTTSCLDLKNAVCVRKSCSFWCFFKLTKIMLVFGQGATFEQTSESVHS